MRIGVVIPAFNMACWLATAIESVVRQTAQNWSLVIVDDGSEDATADIAAAFQDDRICLIRQANAGVSAARNRGLMGLEADAILFLDADDWLAPDALEILSATLKKAPWAVAAVSGYTRVSTDGTCQRFKPPASGDLLDRLLVRNLFANGGHLLIRQQAIQLTGRFNTNLSYGEDWEYWTRLALAGHFAAVRPSKPLLFIRERVGSSYLTMASEAACYAAAMDAVFGNRAIAARTGDACLARLRTRSDAEVAWVIGRELIRHRRPAEGRTWLFRSIRLAPSIKRTALFGMSWIGCRPFRAYRTLHSSTLHASQAVSGKLTTSQIIDKQLVTSWHND